MHTTLLVDGKDSFDEILRCIRQARNSILINMFIWRDDVIGKEIGTAVLEAANRGVQVTISVDRVGMILELCEEYEQSFFHRTPTFYESMKIQFLRIAYFKNRAKNKMAASSSTLLERILSHPNIVVDKDRVKNDHSKFYIFDDRILILGGINIEDKERIGDCSGRIYQDYMLKLDSESYVSTFFQKLHQNKDTSLDYCFRMNNKTISPANFEIHDRFLSIINEAQKELVIVMAYFSPIPDIVNAILNAWKRGVHIRILVSERANFQNDSNRRTMYLLMKRSRGNIRISFSPKMVHTKLIYNEHTAMFGSANITKRAFHQLGELNIELNNNDSPLIKHLKETVEHNFSISHEVKHYHQIRFSPIWAFTEGLFN